MSLKQEQLLEALRELEDPAPFWMLYSHMATIEPDDLPSDSDDFLREVKTVLNIAVGQGLVEEKDDLFCLAPRSEGEGVVREAIEHETVNVASTVSFKDEELIIPSFMELSKLADKKSHAHKRGGKRKQEIPAESDNADDYSATKRKEKGMYCLAQRSEGEGVEREAIEHETVNVASTVSTMDEELIKAATMEFRKLLRLDKKSQAQKRGCNREPETAGDNSGIKRRCKNVATRSPITSSSDDEHAGIYKMFYDIANERRAADSDKRGAKGKRGRY